MWWFPKLVGKEPVDEAHAAGAAVRTAADVSRPPGGFACTINTSRLPLIVRWQAMPAQGEPRKSPNDRKAYRLHTLPNGLQALLVHDPEIGREAAPAAGARLAAEASDSDVDSLMSGDEDEGSSEVTGHDQGCSTAGQGCATTAAQTGGRPLSTRTPAPACIRCWVRRRRMAAVRRRGPSTSTCTGIAATGAATTAAVR